MSINRHVKARSIPEGERFGTGAAIADLECGLNAVLTSMRPVKYFSTAAKAFAMERIVDTGRLSAGSRTTGTRDGAAQSSS